MQLQLDASALLVQFGYSINEATLKQMEKIIANTKNFEKFSKHLLSLEDKLKHTNALIAMSNTHDYLKIKSETSSEELVKEFEQIVHDWAMKYNIELQKVYGKTVYYIVGHIKD